MQQYGLGAASGFTLPTLGSVYGLQQHATQHVAQHAAGDFRPAVHALTLAERLAGEYRIPHTSPMDIPPIVRVNEPSK